MRLRSVVEGKLVNIPVLEYIAMEGRRKVGQPTVGCRFKEVGGGDRKIRFPVNAEIRRR